ncbi:hypothetical protein pb186bvf_020223 [Paramecium bursaria]
MIEIQKKFKKLKDKPKSELIVDIVNLALQSEESNEDLFETLQEQKFFKAFLEVMHKSRRHCSVVIENMSMLVFNVKKPTNKMYMIGQLQDFILFPYDFNDEDLVSHYMNFLKTLALMVNKDNFQMYYNSRYPQFPLLWQAQKFITYQDNMVQITASNIIINLTKLSQDADQVGRTQSIIFIQNDWVRRFRDYLQFSPFRMVWQIYVIMMRRNWFQMELHVNNPSIISELEQKDNDLIEYFQDLYNSCHFMRTIFNEAFIKQAILPLIIMGIQGQQYENKKIGIQVSLFILNKLASTLNLGEKIANLLTNEQIGSNDITVYNQILPEKWLYIKDTEHIMQQFSEYFKQQDQVYKYEFEQVQKIPNPIKNQFLSLFHSKEHKLLELMLSLMLKLTQFSDIDLSQYIKKILYTEEQVQTIELINLLTQFIRTQKDHFRLEVSQYLKVVAAKIETQLKSVTAMKYLCINWHLVEDFDFNKQTQIDITSQLQIIQANEKLEFFKQVYKFVLLSQIYNEHKLEKQNQLIQYMDLSGDDKYFDCQIVICLSWMSIMRNQKMTSQTIKKFPAFGVDISHDESNICNIKKRDICLFTLQPLDIKMTGLQFRNLCSAQDQQQNKKMEFIKEYLSVLVNQQK